MPNDSLDQTLQNLSEQYNPGEIHELLKDTEYSAENSKDKSEMILALMQAGIPLNEIPKNDLSALTILYNDKVLNIHPNDFSEDENNTFNSLFSSPIEKYIKVANIIESLDNKGYFSLADKIDKLSSNILNQERYAFLPELDVSYLSGEPQQLPVEQSALSPNSPDGEYPEEDFEDEEVEPAIAPKDIDSLLDKLEAVMDAMGDDFDPDLIPVAKKILKELLDKFEQIEAPAEEAPVEEIPSEEDIPPQAEPPKMPELAPNAPAMANILKSTIKLAQTANLSNNLKIINDIDDLIIGITQLRKTIK